MADDNKFLVDEVAGTESWWITAGKGKEAALLLTHSQYIYLGLRKNCCKLFCFKENEKRLTV